MQTGDKEALLDGVPEGATFKQARELILPARTWVDTGMDGIEIYLDAEQNARLLVRQVGKPAQQSARGVEVPGGAGGVQS